MTKTIDSFMDTINFEETANQLTELKAIIFNDSETHQAKLQFIKEELSTDRYQIHSDHIAAKLMEYAPVIVEETEIA